MTGGSSYGRRRHQHVATSNNSRHCNYDIWHQETKSLGSDLGSAVKGFRKSIQDNPPSEIEQPPTVPNEDNEDSPRAP